MPKASIEKQNRWFNYLSQWQSSQKSAAKFCKENGINYQNFCLWKKKLKPKPYQVPSEAFFEIKDRSDEGLVLEYRDFYFHLNPDFNSETFVKCLQLLKEI